MKYILHDMEAEPIWGGSVSCIFADEETGPKQKKKKAKQLSKLVWGMMKRKKNLKEEAIYSYSASDDADFSPSRAAEFDLFPDTEGNLDKEDRLDNVFTPFEKNLIERMFEEEEDAITIASTPYEENPGQRNFDTDEETSKLHGQRMFDKEEEEGICTPNEHLFSENGDCWTENDCILDIKMFEMTIANKPDRKITEDDESEANAYITRKLFYDDESLQRELEANGSLLYNTPKRLKSETPEVQITAPLKMQEFGPLLELKSKDAAEDTQMGSIQVEMKDLWYAAKEVIAALKLGEDVNETSQEIGKALSKYYSPHKTVDEIVRHVTDIPPVNEVRVITEKSVKTQGSAQTYPIVSTCEVPFTETGLEMRYKTPKKGPKQGQTTIILPSNESSRCEVLTSSSPTACGMNAALNDSDVFESIDSPDKPLRDPETSSIDSPDKSIRAKAVNTCFPTFDLEASTCYTEFEEMEKNTTKDEEFSPFAKRCAEQSKSSNEDDLTTETEKSQDLRITFGPKAKTARQESNEDDVSPFEKKFSDKSGASDDKLPVKREQRKYHNKLECTSKPDCKANVSYDNSEESVESEVVLTPFTSFESETRTPVKESKDWNENDFISIDMNDDFANGFPSPVYDQARVVTVAIKNSRLKIEKVDFDPCTPQKATKKPSRSAKDLPLMFSDVMTLLSSLQSLSLGMTASADSNTEGASKENVQDVLQSMKDECTERLDYNVNKISDWKHLQKCKKMTSSTAKVRGVIGDGYKAPPERQATLYQERPALAQKSNVHEMKMKFERNDRGLYNASTSGALGITSDTRKAPAERLSTVYQERPVLVEKENVMNSLSSPVGTADFPNDEVTKDKKRNRQSLISERIALLHKNFKK